MKSPFSRNHCAPGQTLMVFSALISLIFLQTAASLQCYYCSIRDEACLDPFTPDNSTMQKACPDWANICIKTVERGARADERDVQIFRGCFQSHFQALEACLALRMAARVEGIDMLSCQTCNTDFCNGITNTQD